jgi:uncharacterized membrane protein
MVTFDNSLFVLKLFAALGCGLMAGVFSSILFLSYNFSCLPTYHHYLIWRMTSAIDQA